jgi:type I restriction enzyme S subunit
VREGDVLFSITAHLGAVAVVPSELEVSYVSQHVALARLRGERLLPNWVALVVLSQIGKNYFASQGYGGTKIQLSLDDISCMPVPVPPLVEQRAITEFLDRETGKIDALVEEQRRLIELLKEKRQAVISHAVTKGLDPSAPMKDSGVEWLGAVPAHWEVTRLANVFREVAEPLTDDLPILSVSIHHGVSDDELDEDDLERKVSRSEDRSKYKRVRPEDLVYNMMRAWQGGFGTVSVDGGVSPAYVVARPTRSVETAFVEWVLRTPQCVEEMRTRSVGVTDFRPRLYWDEFKDLKIALPPLTEQQQLLKEIGAEVARYRTLADTAEAAISLLTERRAALISAAVTGKIDVREPAAAAAELEPA